jgi:hypothetical protein
MERDKIAAEIVDLKNDSSTQKAQIVDLTAALRVLRAFRDKFNTFTVVERVEVLRDVIAAVKIYQDRVDVDVYGVESPVTFIPKKTNGDPECIQSPVRPLFHLVEVTPYNTNHAPWFENIESSGRREGLTCQSWQNYDGLSDGLYLK